MAAHNLLSKCDRALVAYLISQEAGTAADIYPAKLSSEKALNDTIVWSERAVETVPYSGTFTVTAHVQVRTLAAVDEGQDPAELKAASEQRVSATFDAFYRNLDQASDKLAEDITTAARATVDTALQINMDLTEFTAVSCTVVAITQGYDDQHGKPMHGSAWVDAMELEIVCCPADVS